MQNNSNNTSTKKDGIFMIIGLILVIFSTLVPLAVMLAIDAVNASTVFECLTLGTGAASIAGAAGYLSIVTAKINK